MKRGIDWRWVGIGTAIMFGLTFVAGLLAAGVLGSSLPVPARPGEVSTATVDVGRLVLAALISVAAFAVGGYVVGLKSPGRTIVEPGISAAIAVALGLLLGGAFSLGNLLAAGLVPFVAGLLGGWLGERAQGRRLGPGP